MSNPFAHLSGEQISATWQIRALREARGKLQYVLWRAMANEYTGITANTWETLLRLINKNFKEMPLPGLLGYAMIVPSGRVVSQVVDKDYGLRLQVIYRHKPEFLSELRRLADRLKLDDLDRADMFAVMGKWITVDYRIGVDGERLAS